MRGPGRNLILAGAALVGLAVAALIVLVVAVTHQAGDSGSTAVVVTPAPAAPAGSPGSTSGPTPTPGSVLGGRPQPVPSFGPSSSAAVKQVTVAPTPGPCDRSGTCTVSTDVTTPRALDAARDISWTVKLFNACTGETTDVRHNTVSAQAGWNHVTDDTAVRMPAGSGPVSIVAVTDGPDPAASAPYTVGAATC